MIDISIVARKAIPDPYAPLELSNEGPPKLAGTALLSDKQATMLGDFALKYLPAHQRNAFRHAVLGKLSDGRPGDGAVRQAMRLTAMEEYGFDMEQLTACGLIIVQDRADTSRRGRAEPSRRQIRKGKFD
jgi:hypothetical protein